MDPDSRKIPIIAEGWAKDSKPCLGRGGSSSGSASDYGSKGPEFDSRYRWELGFFLSSISLSSLLFPIILSVVCPKSGPSWRCNTTGFQLSKEKFLAMPSSGELV